MPAILYMRPCPPFRRGGGFPELAEQKDGLERYCKSHMISIRAIFTDKAGRCDRFLASIDEAFEHTDCWMSWSLLTMGRTVEQAVRVIRDLSEENIRIVLPGSNFDSFSVDGKRIINFFGPLSDIEPHWQQRVHTREEWTTRKAFGLTWKHRQRYAGRIHKSKDGKLRMSKSRKNHPPMRHDVTGWVEDATLGTAFE